MDSLKTYQEVAKCDVCNDRPGVRTLYPYGIQTWVCGKCSGDEDEEEAP